MKPADAGKPGVVSRILGITGEAEAFPTGDLFAQFNIDSPSSDLINTDYTFGIPATYRYGDNSLRFRIYHQSSHLGDRVSRQRRLRLMAEWYNGFDPHGQFYNNKVEYFGMGVSLGF